MLDQIGSCNFNLKRSTRKWCLSPEIPELSSMNPILIREINQNFQLPFLYTGSSLLSPVGKKLAHLFLDAAGRCLGGGVFSSRDLEWLAKGSRGEKPGDYIPSRGLLGITKKPQSINPSEWIAFEFGILLLPPTDKQLILQWDQVNEVKVIRQQSRDLHIKLDLTIDAQSVSIFGQANANGMQNLISIAHVMGVPTGG